MALPSVRVRFITPPNFCQGDFRPLSYGAIWTFDPLEVVDVFRHYQIWRDFSSLIKPNYFSDTVTLLSIVGAMVSERNRKRKTKWKSQNVSYLARSYARKGEWGQFIYLESFLSKGDGRGIEPSVVPLILPQKILDIARKDNSWVVSEFMSEKRIKV